LPGSLLEALARLFTQNVRLYVYPMPAEELQRRAAAANLTGWTWKEVDGMVSANNLHPAGPLDCLYQYLLKSEFVLPAVPRRALSTSGS